MKIASFYFIRLNGLLELWNDKDLLKTLLLNNNKHRLQSSVNRNYYESSLITAIKKCSYFYCRFALAFFYVHFYCYYSLIIAFKRAWLLVASRYESKIGLVYESYVIIFTILSSINIVTTLYFRVFSLLQIVDLSERLVMVF